MLPAPVTLELADHEASGRRVATAALAADIEARVGRVWQALGVFVRADRQGPPSRWLGTSCSGSRRPRARAPARRSSQVRTWLTLNVDAGGAYSHLLALADPCRRARCRWRARSRNLRRASGDGAAERPETAMASATTSDATTRDLETCIELDLLSQGRDDPGKGGTRLGARRYIGCVAVRRGRSLLPPFEPLRPRFGVIQSRVRPRLRLRRLPPAGVRPSAR